MIAEKENKKLKGSMNKLELIERMAASFPSKKDARLAVCKTFELIEQALKSDKKVVISNFGTFFPKERLPRTMHNPKTQKPVITKTRLSIRFKPAKNLIKITE